MTLFSHHNGREMSVYVMETVSTRREGEVCRVSGGDTKDASVKRHFMSEDWYLLYACPLVIKSGTQEL